MGLASRNANRTARRNHLDRARRESCGYSGRGMASSPLCFPYAIRQFGFRFCSGHCPNEVARARLGNDTLGKCDPPGSGSVLFTIFGGRISCVSSEALCEGGNRHSELINIETCLTSCDSRLGPFQKSGLNAGADGRSVMSFTPGVSCRRRGSVLMRVHALAASPWRVPGNDASTGGSPWMRM